MFDCDPERYDRARPRYPDALFADLADYAGLRAGCRVLEIGCGTGQATSAMAERGWAVDAIELGEALAALAARYLDRFPHVSVRTGSFDTVAVPGGYDAVAAFTSFHWLDPATRVRRAADALRRRGVLATVATVHVQGGDGFFRDAQRCYLRWDPETDEWQGLPRPEEVRRDAAEIDATGLFAPAEFREYSVDIVYATGEYLDLLQTYSGTLLMPPREREGLLRCLADLIDDEYGGRITKSYMFQLRMARLRR